MSLKIDAMLGDEGGLRSGERSSDDESRDGLDSRGQAAGWPHSVPAN